MRPRVGAPDGPDAMWRPCSARDDVGQLVGRAHDPWHDLVAREAQRPPTPAWLDAEHVAADDPRGFGAPALRGQPVEERHVRVLEPVDDVAGARHRAAEAVAQAVRDGWSRRARRGDEGGLVEPVGGAHRAPQPGDSPEPSRIIADTRPRSCSPAGAARGRAARP